MAENTPKRDQHARDLRIVTTAARTLVDVITPGATSEEQRSIDELSAAIARLQAAI